MSNAALAFLAGFGSGYLKQGQYEEEQARQKKQDQRAQEEHDARMAEARKKQAGDTAIAQAYAPTIPGGNDMSKPAYADDRDVGNDPAAMIPMPTATANTPDAQRMRAVTALRGLGDIDRADKLEAGGLQLQEAQAQQADRAWLRKIGVAMEGGHPALADLATQSEFGSMKGKKVQLSTSADGKSVTYNTVGDDGALTPIGTFSNDAQGVAQAGFLLDRTVTPEARLESFRKDAKDAREAKKVDAEANKDNATADYFRQRNTGTTKAGKMDEEDKIRLNAANTAVRDAEKQVFDALKGVQDGSDPEKSPAVVYARKALTDAKRSQLKTHIELGQIPASSMADTILGAAKDRKGVMASINDLAGLVGTDYLAKVKSIVQGSDSWKRMAGTEPVPIKSQQAKAVAKAPPGTVVLQPDGSYAAPGAAAPAVSKPAAAAGLPLPEAPAQFARNPQLDAQLLAEDTEMANGKRMQYSPAVATYAKSIYAAKLAEQQAQRAAAGRRAVAAARGIPTNTFGAPQ